MEITYKLKFHLINGLFIIFQGLYLYLNSIKLPIDINIFWLAFIIFKFCFVHMVNFVLEDESIDVV